MNISMEVHKMTLTIAHIYNIIQEHVQKNVAFQFCPLAVILNVHKCI